MAAAGKAATVLINVELSIQAYSVPLILHGKQKPTIPHKTVDLMNLQPKSV